jgi:hypothetical protein
VSFQLLSSKQTGMKFKAKESNEALARQLDFVVQSGVSPY